MGLFEEAAYSRCPVNYKLDFLGQIPDQYASYVAVYKPLESLPELKEYTKKYLHKAIDGEADNMLSPDAFEKTLYKARVWCTTRSARFDVSSVTVSRGGGVTYHIADKKIWRGQTEYAATYGESNSALPIREAQPVHVEFIRDVRADPTPQPDIKKPTPPFSLYDYITYKE